MSSRGEGLLADVTAEWDSRPSLGVVMAAKGYPNSYQKGDSISLPESSSSEKSFMRAQNFITRKYSVMAAGYCALHLLVKI
jgi:phosphoribosylamine--glycine ligase